MAKLTGTNPDQVPSNADLGDMAYKDGENLQAGPLTIKDGRVGIGDVSPASELHLSADSPVISFESENNSSGIRYNVRGTATQAHRFQYGGTTLLEIAATGDTDVNGELIATSYNETYSALSGTTPTVNCEAGNVFSLTTSGNTTFTFSNPPASGIAYGFMLRLTAGGTHTITYPASIDWPGATAPTAPDSGETDVLVFTTTDGGTTWYGALAIDAAG